MLGGNVALVAALVLGVRIHRPSPTRPWQVLIVGTTLYAIASAIWCPAQAGYYVLSFPSIADPFYLAAYVFLLVGVGLLIRARTVRRDRGGFLDTLIMVGGIGVLSWVFLMERYWETTGLSMFPKLVSVSYPLIDLLLLAVGVRLAFLPGTRSPAAALLGMWLGCQLGADTIYAATVLHGTFSARSPAFVLWILSYVFLGTTALHPSMRTLTQRIHEPEQPPPRWRTPLITAAALIPPVVLIMTNTADVRVVAAISAALFVLAMVRVSDLMMSVRRTQRRLGETELKYRTLIEQVPAAVYTAEVGSGGRWLYISPHIEEVLGYTPSEWMADPGLFLERLFPEDRVRVLADSEHSGTTGEPIRTDYRLVARDGRTVWVRDEAIVIADEHGRPAFWQGILTDVTPFRETQEAIERLNTELEARVVDRTAQLEVANTDLRLAKEAAEQANRAKSEFLSRTSHELRTPLNAILGFGQLLEVSTLSANDRASVAHIMKGGRQLLELINEVLDIARIDTNRMEVSIEPVSVEEVLSEAMALVRPLAASHNVVLERPPAEPAWYVLADRQRLSQVLHNLLSNAIKYNRDGGTASVSFTRSSHRTFTIRVADTGPGIPPDQMEQLFFPFARLGAERTGTEGTGLGLVLAKGLIEAMGGTIHAATEVGTGSIFSIELPLGDDPRQRVQAPPSPTRRILDRTEHRVLCIDDNSANLALVEQVLSHRPTLRLLSARQGRLGLDLAKEYQPSLILLDLHLPDISGEETLRLLREDERTRDIPVIVASAEASPGMIERLLAAGAVGYLTKPLDVNRLLGLVDELVAGRTIDRPSEEAQGGPAWS
jgi:PAS domain S-box-containing protein